MASKMLKRYGMEGIAKVLIATGLLLLLISWIAGVYYFGIIGSIALFIVPVVFTFISALLLLVIRYRYTLFEKYPYLMNLPSLFYRIGQQKDGASKQSMAFSMIFTVHALVMAVVGFLSLILTVSIGASIKTSAASPFLYVYLATAAIMAVSVLLLYCRIYIKFMK